MDNHTLILLNQCGIDRNRIEQRDLSEMDLSHRALIGVDLRGFTLTKTNLEYTNLTGSILRGVVFASTNCVYACFIGADLRGANLAFGYFTNADFRGADLRGARIADALCSESNFSGADLRGALLGSEHFDSDFRGADLRGVDVPEGCEFEKLNCDIGGALLSPKKATAARNKRILKRTQIIPHVKVFDRQTSNQAGILLDITTQGIKMSSEYPYTIGGVFALQFMLPGQNIPIDFDAKCMWCNPEEHNNLFYAGFQIHAISDQHVTLIEDFIVHNEKKGIEIGDDETGDNSLDC